MRLKLLSAERNIHRTVFCKMAHSALVCSQALTVCTYTVYSVYVYGIFSIGNLSSTVTTAVRYSSYYVLRV